MSRPIFKAYKGEKISFEQRLQDGYVCLDPFIPLLSDLSSLKYHGDDPLFENLDDMITSQFNILIDTDRSGTRWITLQKAHELWDLLRMQDDLNTGGSSIKRDEDTNGHAQDDEGRESTGGSTTDATSKNGNGSQKNENANSSAPLSQQQEQQQQQQEKNQEPPQKQQQKQQQVSGSSGNNAGNDNVSSTQGTSRDSSTPSAPIDTNLKGDQTDQIASGTDEKAYNSPTTGKHDLGEHIDSPTKRHQTQSVSVIPVFKHDLPTVSTLQKTLPSITNYTAEERVKLETLLQRILFPETSPEDAVTSSNGYPVIDLGQQLQELDAQFPNVKLNLNIPIDEHGNTALHWLCSIANLDLLKQHIMYGSDRRIGDKSGESVLVKSVKSVNNYDSGTFEALLDYLYPCIVLVDEMDRTVLHHIVITSGMPGCNAAAKYYLDILMGWVVKKQSRSKESECALLEDINLQWVITRLLNARDSNGDTCLNIAARLGNVAIVEALLDYGADPSIANNSGLCPLDFGAGTQPRFQANSKAQMSTPTKINEAEPDPMAESATLITNIKSLLSKISDDYEDEVKQHNSRMSELLKTLNNKREVLAKARDRLAKAKQVQDEYNLLSDRLNNVENTIAEEDQNFQLASRELGLSLDDVQAEGLNSSDIIFDADEPFRISYVNTKFEEKIKNDYNNDFELFLKHCDLSKFAREIYESIPDTTEIPHPRVLKARIKAYTRNESHLESTLQTIKNKQRNLESKFRKVLSLCLKIDEEKVDSMLDGLLQAISNEDPEDIDTEEVNNFLESAAE